MKSFKEMIRNELQSKAVKRALNDYLDDIGTYVVKDTGEIIYHIDTHKVERLEKYDFRFPSINEIIKRAKASYSNFDETKLSKICYIFKDLSFYKKIFVSARSSDVIFAKCKFFNGIVVDDANEVSFVNRSASNGVTDIKANKLKIVNFALMSSSEDSINIMSRETEIIKSSLISNSADMRIDSDVLYVSNQTYIYAKNLYVSANKINFDDSNLKGKEEIQICYKEGDLMFENKDELTTEISQSNETFKLRCKLINYLEEIKSGIQKNYKNEDLDSKPIQKI